MDILDQALGMTAEQDPAPAAETPAEAAPGGQQRGPDGKFASAQPEAAPVEQPAPAPVAEAPKAPEPGHVPMAALLDERDKRKALEDRLKALESAQPAANAPELDPDTQNALLQTRLNISEEMARDKFGDELVNKARDWIVQRFAENPAFQQEVLGKPNPYKFTVQEYQRHERLSAVSDDSEWTAFQTWKAAGGTSAAPPAPQAAAAAPVAAAPPTPPASIAAAPNAGGNVNTAPVGPGVAFDTVIK